MISPADKVCGFKDYPYEFLYFWTSCYPHPFCDQLVRKRLAAAATLFDFAKTRQDHSLAGLTSLVSPKHDYMKMVQNLFFRVQKMLPKKMFQPIFCCSA